MMFGYGKDKKYESFPYDWIKPKEIQYDWTRFDFGEIGTFLIKGGMYEFYIRPCFRKYILMLPAIFWMKHD